MVGELSLGRLSLLVNLALAYARERWHKTSPIPRVDCSNVHALVVEPHNVTDIAERYKVCRFFVLRGSLDEELLPTLRDAANAFLRDPPTGFALPGLRAGRAAWALPYERQWASAAEQLVNALRPALDALLGGDAWLEHAELLVARAGHGVSQDWHLDHPKRDARLDRQFGTRVHILGGWLPLQFVGSRLGPLGVRTTGPRGEPYELDVGPQLELGDAVFYDKSLPHAGKANHEDHDRLILVYNFCLRGLPEEFANRPYSEEARGHNRRWKALMQELNARDLARRRVAIEAQGGAVGPYGTPL